MNMQPSDQRLITLFQQLRAAGLPLGIQELLAAQRAITAGYGAEPDTATDDPLQSDALKRLLKLLWCSNAGQNAELERQWDNLKSVPGGDAPEHDQQDKPDKKQQQASPTAQQQPQPSTPDHPVTPTQATTVLPLPVRAPQTLPGSGENTLINAGPVTRRSMAYAWHHLRKPVKDGPLDRPDLAATVDRAARQGFFDRPVLQRRASDHAHLLLLVDQGGSMVPFHRLTRELVETVTAAGLGCLDIGYFHNTPADAVYSNPHRTQPVQLGDLLADCTDDASVLIVSDAGAARGSLEQQRFRAMARVLISIKQRTTQLAWLNPVPAQRWSGTTAQLIGALLPMFAMDEDGFSNAVDILRGQIIGEQR